MDVIIASFEICKSSSLSILLHGVISLPDETSCDKVTIYMYMTKPTS